ncbi:MAG: Fe-S protein assembly co-chaperone HscB [Candidatus Tumulicola sp.]
MSAAASMSGDKAGAEVVGVNCWNCQQPAKGAHFCPGCGKIQPLSRSVSYFEFLGLPKKLQIDGEALEQKFQMLSWKLHPDNFTRAGESERNLSLERSSELNDAYRTLRDPVTRVEYLLAHEGMRKEGTTKQQADPELLEEVFELNEALDELREGRESGESPEQLAELRGKLQEAQEQFQSELNKTDERLVETFGEWDKAIDRKEEPEQKKERLEELMGEMNEILNRRSYIRNLVASVSKELEV